MPSFSRRTVSTMDGQVGIWNGTLETSLHRKFVGGGSSLGDGSAIGSLLLCGKSLMGEVLIFIKWIIFFAKILD